MKALVYRFFLLEKQNSLFKSFERRIQAIPTFIKVFISKIKSWYKNMILPLSLVYKISMATLRQSFMIYDLWGHFWIEGFITSNPPSFQKRKVKSQCRLSRICKLRDEKSGSLEFAVEAMSFLSPISKKQSFTHIRSTSLIIRSTFKV